MVFDGRVQIGAACSMALFCTLFLPILSQDCCAERLTDLLCSDEPGGEVMRLAESLRRRRKGREGRGDQRTDARHRHQPSRDLVLLGSTADLNIKPSDLSLQLRQCRDQDLEPGGGGDRQAGRVPGLRRLQSALMYSRPLRHDLPKLAQMAAQSIYGLVPLPDQKLAHAKHHGRALCLLTLHRNKAHRRARRRLANRFGIGHIILLELHEGFDLGRQNELHLMAQCADLAAQICAPQQARMATTQGRQLSKKLNDLILSQLFAQHLLA